MGGVQRWAIPFHLLHSKARRKLFPNAPSLRSSLPPQPPVVLLRAADPHLDCHPSANPDGDPAAGLSWSMKMRAKGEEDVRTQTLRADLLAVERGFGEDRV